MSTDAMSKRNLLLCFDAFGTIFKPKRSVAQQYGEVARQLGLSGCSDDDVNASFKKAFKQEAKLHPNYGKAVGMNAEKWWTEIIRNTFKPLVPAGQALPSELVPKLLHRFWCREGYAIFPDFLPALQAFRAESSRYRVVVGVLTNSDDRVPDILTDFGLRVSPLRFGTPIEAVTRPTEEYDIDFHCLSYDVGYEKPDKAMFHAADVMLKKVLGASGDDDEVQSISVGHGDWLRVYVGDEFDKDAMAAVNVGWEGVLIDRETFGNDQRVAWLDEVPVTSKSTENGGRPIGFKDLTSFADFYINKR